MTYLFFLWVLFRIPMPLSEKSDRWLSNTMIAALLLFFFCPLVEMTFKMFRHVTPDLIHKPLTVVYLVSDIYLLSCITWYVFRIFKSIIK